MRGRAWVLAWAAIAAAAAAGCGGDRSPPAGPVLVLDYAVDVPGGDDDAQRRALDRGVEVVQRRIDLLGRRVRHATVSRRAGMVHVELIGELPPDVADHLAGKVSLGFHRVLEGDDSVATAARIAIDPALAAPVGVAPALTPILGVTTESETWTDQAGVHHWAGFVRARSAVQLDAAIPHLSPDAVPDGYRVAVEQLPGTGDGPAPARTYVVETHPFLDGTALTSVAIDRDPTLGQPVLQVVLDAAGAAILAEVSTAELGHKLAILVDGRVASAPVVSGRIADGRVAITLGGAPGDPIERQAVELAAVLRSGALAPPLRLQMSRVIDRGGRGRR